MITNSVQPVSHNRPPELNQQRDRQLCADLPFSLPAKLNLPNRLGPATPCLRDHTQAWQTQSHPFRLSLSPALQSQLNQPPLSQLAAASTAQANQIHPSEFTHQVILPRLLVVLKILLLRYTGRSDLLVSTILPGAIPALKSSDHTTWGLTLRPTLSQLRAETSLAEAIALETTEWEAGAEPRATTSQDWEALALSLESSAEFPLLQVLLMLHCPEHSLEQLAQQSANLRSLLEQQFAFALQIDQIDQHLVGRIQYNPQQFAPATIDRMVGHLQLLLNHFTHLDQPIGQLPLITDAEWQQIQAWNSTTMAYDRSARVSQLMEAQVATHPDAIALIYRDQQLTYQEFNQRVNQLAHYLQIQGVKPNCRVGVCLQRSPEWLIAVYAIYKVGATYVPLDPDYPRDRIEFMLADSAAAILITQTSVAELLNGEGLHKVLLDRDANAIAQQPSENLAHTLQPLNPEDLAYILYTSGSTGKPKGVMIPHRALTNFILTMAETPGLKASDTMLGLTTFSFDMAGLELFGPLSVGARLVIIDRDIAMDGVRLAQVIEQQQITLMQATPTNWRLLIEAGWIGARSLRILCGGEGWPRALANDLLDRSAQLWNMYGPTETTVWSTCHRVQPNQPGVPVGKPVGNTQIYLLDPHQQPVPLGIAGEIYISGEGVAHGYLNRPETSQERFLVNPFGHDPTALIYRTGDLGRYLADGSIECLGRIDHQVKLRGFRIELGEIESVLESHPTVQQAVVIAREDQPGDQRLVGYITAAPNQTIVAAELKHLLQKLLPEYMVPAALVLLAEFPLTPNGKVDRKLLPAPSREQLSSSEATSPRNALEHQLVFIWQEVLGITPIGIHDNFFDLGGQSLLASRLANRINTELQKTLAPTTIFQYPSIAELSTAWSQLTHPTAASVVVIQTGNPEILPLFCIHVLGEACGFYRPLVSHLGKQQPVYGLSAQMLDKKTAPVNRVEDIAAFYIREMKTIQPKGPYRLAGVSFGGQVTYEMARQLKAKGETVSLVALLDTFGPDHSPWDNPERLLKHLIYFQQEGMNYLGESIRNRFQLLWIRMLYLYGRCCDRFGIQPPDRLHLDLLVAENHHACDSYQPQPFTGKVTVFRATERVFYSRQYQDNGLGWRNLARGGVEVYDIPGEHITMLQDPHVAVLAQRLQDCLARAQ